jgi:hypothetical protein
MGQDNILSILTRNRRKWFSCSKILPLSGCSPQSTKKSFSRVVKFKNVYGVEVRVSKRNKFFIRVK